jgi:hypothetical protein
VKLIGCVPGAKSENDFIPHKQRSSSTTWKLNPAVMPESVNPRQANVS